MFATSNNESTARSPDASLGKDDIDEDKLRELSQIYPELGRKPAQLLPEAPKSHHVQSVVRTAQRHCLYVAWVLEYWPCSAPT